MPRKPKSTSPDAPAPVPAEILDQFVGQGPISHEELEAAVRRFKKAIIERALGSRTLLRRSTSIRRMQQRGDPYHARALEPITSSRMLHGRGFPGILVGGGGGASTRPGYRSGNHKHDLWRKFTDQTSPIRRRQL